MSMGSSNRASMSLHDGRGVSSVTAIFTNRTSNSNTLIAFSPGERSIPVSGSAVFLGQVKFFKERSYRRPCLRLPGYSVSDPVLDEPGALGEQVKLRAYHLLPVCETVS